MGWRGKFLFLVIVYFAGFATAVYYLAPSGGEGNQGSFYSTQMNTGEDESTGALNQLREKAYASLANVDLTKFKEAFSRCMHKLIEEVKNSRSSNVEGSEDK
jgi:hypothetical protein